jgi:glutathione S-transferase
MTALATTRSQVILHQPPGRWGEPSMSPFCMKLECWLRMSGIAFEIRPPDMRKAPKGKMPYVTLPDGTLLGDSQLVIEHLSRVHGVDLDAHLDGKQRATSRVVRRMIEEATYFTGIYARWIDDAGWAHTKTAMATMLPGPVRLFMPLIRRNVVKNVHAQGTGRHTAEDIYAMARADWDAIATLLGDGPYFFGEKASSIDAVLYAFEEAALAHPAALPAKLHLERTPSLVAHRDRMRAFFPPDRFGAPRAS